jgi:hypothetical protein
VLIVDDNHDVLGLLHTTREREGYIVCCLDNGKFLEDTVILYNRFSCTRHYAWPN